MIQVEFDLSRAIGLTDAANLCRGRRGKRLRVETLRRWANPAKGCRPAGKDGAVLILETRRINGEVLTMPEWVAEFERTRAAMGQRRDVLSLPVVTTARRRKEIERAERQADAMGL